MTTTHNPDPEEALEGGTAPGPAIEVEVARTGGIAGITRRWSAQPPEAEASEWISLIDSCPWDEATASSSDDGAGDDGSRQSLVAANPVPDGFMWWIRATWSGADPREARLPDDDVVGAWRRLIDAVRDRSRAGPERGAAGR
ncbi:hypothetical protein [Microbacterium sp. E-13]|uniref:hypothetical protein n=1 Tax=Microbacterium sp. E-13 TaxID=3404048 RepID=UPI003CF733F2